MEFQPSLWQGLTPGIGSSEKGLLPWTAPGPITEVYRKEGYYGLWH